MVFTHIVMNTDADGQNIPKFHLNVNWGALAPMDKTINPPNDVTLANSHRNIEIRGVEGSTQSRLQGLIIVSIYSIQ